MNYGFRFDPAPPEVNKSLSIDIQEKLDIDRPTKSVVFGQNSFGFSWRKAAQKGCKYFRMELYPCADTADSFFLSGHKEHFSQLLDFSRLEQSFRIHKILHYKLQMHSLLLWVNVKHFMGK